MSHFVYDRTSLNNTKTNLGPIPIGADANQWVQADEDWNPLCNAAIDLRDVILGGKFYGFQTQVDDPAPAGIDTYLWVRSDLTFILHTTSGNMTFLTGARQILTPALGGLQGGGSLNADLSLSLRDLAPSPAGSYTTANITVNARGQITAAASGVSSPLTDKGDLYTYATDPSGHVERLPVGTDGQYLTADSSTHTGLLWKTLVTTLQGSYDGYPVAPAAIELNNVLGGILIRDGDPALAAVLLAVQNHEGTVDYFGVYADHTWFQNNITFDGTVNHTLKVANATVPDADGKALLFEAGFADGAGRGGDINFNSGNGGTSGRGGDWVSAAGNGGGVGRGGDWVAFAGNGGATGRGGDANGYGGNGAEAGGVFWCAGNATDAGTTGGTLDLWSGNGLLVGGPITLWAGTGPTGGSIDIAGGNGAVVGGEVTVDGGGGPTGGRVGIAATLADRLDLGRVTRPVTIYGDLYVPGALGCYDYTSGEAIAQYSVVYVTSTAGNLRVMKAVNTAEATARVVGVCTLTAVGVDQPTTLTTCGIYGMSFDVDPTTADFGRPVYLSGTAGKVTITAPGAGTILIRVGYLMGSGTNAPVAIHVGDEYQQ